MFISTENYFFSCCVLLLVFENFILSILLCFLSLINMIVLNSFKRIYCINSFKMSQFSTPDSLHIYPILIDKPNAKSQSVFPVHWWTENSKKLSFLAGGLLLTSPQCFFSLTRPPATQAMKHENDVSNMVASISKL